MKTKLSLITGIILILLVSNNCRPKKDNNNAKNKISRINVEPTKSTTIELSNLIKDIRVIPLQTLDSSIMGNVLGLKKVNNKFYIKTGQEIFVFDEQGRFLNTIGTRGKGPEELLAITNYYVDPESEEVEIYDGKKSQLIYYNSNGTFDRSINHSFKNGYDYISGENGGYFFYLGFFLSQNIGELIYVPNIKENAYTELLPYNKTLSKYLHFGDLVNFIQNQYGTYFTRSFNDTIFEVRTQSIQPKYIVDFGKSKLPKNLLYSDYNDVRELMMVCQNSPYAFRVMGFFETEHYILFGYNYNKKIWNAFFDKRTNKTSVASSYVVNYFGSDFEIEPGFDLLPKGADESSIFICIDAYKVDDFIVKFKRTLKNKELNSFDELLKKNKLNNIQEMDNPIIIDIKLN